MLALYNVTLASLIAILGNPVTGRLFDLVGARWLYAIAALGYLLGWLSLRAVAPAPAKPETSPQ